MFSVQNATPADFVDVLALQELNHGSNLSEHARGDSFLTSRLTLQRLQEMSARTELVVARAPNGAFAGFAGAEPWDFSGENRFHRAVLQLFPLQLENQPIEGSRCFQYGPVCVAQPFRGQGVLPLLFGAVRANFRARFPWGITFVDARNARSLQAHTRKLAMPILASLPYEGVVYHVLGFSTRA